MIPTQFDERPVPVEIREFGVMGSWKPADGRDFRILYMGNGKWRCLPKVKLTQADYDGIAILREWMRTNEQKASSEAR